MSDFDVLVDSDAFTGFFLPDDALHTRTNAAFTRFADQCIRLVATNYIVAETATVLSRRSDQATASRFLEFIRSGNFPIIYVDRELHLNALELFMHQPNKNTSVFDCSNVVVMQQFGIPQIFSFDAVYTRKFGLQAVV